MRTFVLLPLLGCLAGGCVESHRAEPVVYHSPLTPPTPVTERPETRVYTSPTPQPSPATAPANVAPGDVVLADSISRLLKSDSHLAGASSSMLVKVRDGNVDLQGSVPTEYDRTEIVQRISQLAGVNQVKDELGVQRP